MMAYWAVCFEPGSISGLTCLRHCVDRVTARSRVAALFEMHRQSNKESYTLSDTAAGQA